MSDESYKRLVTAIMVIFIIVFIILVFYLAFYNPGPVEGYEVISQMDPKPMMLPKSTWSRAVWDGTMQSMGLPKSSEPFYNEDALYLTMAMIYSDSDETLKDLLHIEDTKAPSEALFRAIYRLALNKLKDKDKVFNIRNYFGL